jgi:hypothetical protein
VEILSVHRNATERILGTHNVAVLSCSKNTEHDVFLAFWPFWPLWRSGDGCLKCQFFHIGFGQAGENTILKIIRSHNIKLESRITLGKPCFANCYYSTIEFKIMFQ